MENNVNHLNSVLIEGNMVRDPNFRRTPRGTCVTILEIASCRYYNGSAGPEKEVCFFTVESYGKIAEACAHLGHKGRGVRIVGRLKQHRWTAADGKTRSCIVVVPEHIEWRQAVKGAVPVDIPEMDFELDTPPVEDEIEEPAVAV